MLDLTDVVTSSRNYSAVARQYGIDVTYARDLILAVRRPDA